VWQARFGPPELPGTRRDLRRQPHVDGVAQLHLFADEDGDVTAAWPTWEGDLSALLHLPAAAFDEHGAYVRYTPDEILKQLEDFVLAASGFSCETGPAGLEPATPGFGGREPRP
jgi:hypothetical protein